MLVPKAGLDPARPLKRGILNPLRLPFRHLGPLLSVYFLVLIFKSTYVNLISVPTKRLPATTADSKCQTPQHNEYWAETNLKEQVNDTSYTARILCDGL